jgi:AcrR family transcriptional regulator
VTEWSARHGVGARAGNRDRSAPPTPSIFPPCRPYRGVFFTAQFSKEELFLAVVEEASARAAAAAAVPAEAPVRERLRATLAAFCAWAGAHEAFARVLVRAEGALRRQPLSDLPAEQLALAIAGLTDLALAQHWSTGGNEPTLEQIPELVLRVVLVGRSPTTGRRSARAGRSRSASAIERHVARVDVGFAADCRPEHMCANGTCRLTGAGDR